MEGRVFEIFQKNQKVFKISKTFKITKMPKNVAKSIQTCFEPILGQCFDFFLRSVRWRLETSKNFKKNPKFFKIPKTTKIVPKSIQTSFDVFWGKLFENFLPNFPWKVESSKIFKKIKNFSNFQKFSKYQKCPKSFPKVSKRILNVFWGKFFEKFLPSFPRMVDS